MTSENPTAVESAASSPLRPWADYVDLLKSADRLLASVPGPKGAKAQADLYRQFALSLAHGYFLYFQSTVDQPEWLPYENSLFTIYSANPDTVYLWTPVDGHGTYRVVGERGSSPVVGFATGKNLLGRDDPPGPGYNNYDVDDLKLKPDGSFEVVFSAERPANLTGNWLYLHPESKFIVARQVSCDWGRDQDMRLAIERLDAPPLKPPMSPEEVDRNLRELFSYVERQSRISIASITKWEARGLVNKCETSTHSEFGQSSQWPQIFWDCLFEIAEDEALIIETELPEVRPYWSITINNPLWNQVDFVHHQSSLNGLQARVDSDGKFRAVVSATDPGVHNWLDTVGNLYGYINGRWRQCSSCPMPTLTKVKLSDVRAHLPADTPIISPEERAAALSKRSIGAQLRKRW